MKSKGTVTQQITALKTSIRKFGTTSDKQIALKDLQSKLKQQNSKKEV